jgi:prepilin-type N-terminal cleavage/methylation domain-containing protein
MIKQRGFTFLEILIVVAIIFMLSALSMTVYSKLNRNQTLTKDVQAVEAILEQARSQALASKNSSVYGIHFASTSVTLFDGYTYNASDPDNHVYMLNPENVIWNATLTGGGLDVVFKRLTGETTQSGIVTLSTLITPATTKTITLYKTGVIQVN